MVTRQVLEAASSSCEAAGSATLQAAGTSTRSGRAVGGTAAPPHLGATSRPEPPGARRAKCPGGAFDRAGGAHGLPHNRMIRTELDWPRRDGPSLPAHHLPQVCAVLATHRTQDLVALVVARREARRRPRNVIGRPNPGWLGHRRLADQQAFRRGHIRQIQPEVKPGGVPKHVVAELDASLINIYSSAWTPWDTGGGAGGHLAPPGCRRVPLLCYHYSGGAATVRLPPVTRMSIEAGVQKIRVMTYPGDNRLLAAGTCVDRLPLASGHVPQSAGRTVRAVRARPFGPSARIRISCARLQLVGCEYHLAPACGGRWQR